MPRTLVACPSRRNRRFGSEPFDDRALLAVGSAVPLVLRRRVPAAVLIVVVLAYVGYIKLEVSQITAPTMAVLIAIYSVGAHEPRALARRFVRPAVIAGLLAFVAIHLVGAQAQLGPNLPLFLVASLSLNAFLYGGASLMGDWHRQRDLYERELDERARELERNRIERENRVVAEERVRITRELHDVVAHHVSVMGVTAGAARTVLPQSPGRAAELLASIEADSRRAIEEMHRLLSALRSDPDQPQPDQAPRLRSVDTLVETARRAGISTRLEVSGSPPPLLPESIDLSAYRILQESVTNAIRHARADTLAIRISYDVDSLTLTVEDDGKATPTRGRHEGRGIIGMRERASLFGGHLEAGPRAGGGFRVHASFPVAS